MGLGFDITKKNGRLDESRPSEYGSWLTKYSANSQQQSTNSWKSSSKNDNNSGTRNDKANPWGPTFKSKQNFLDMHFC